jgi:hypothetical protein
VDSYLPEVASRRWEPDCFDVVEGLAINDGLQVEVLKGITV